MASTLQSLQQQVQSLQQQLQQQQQTQLGRSPQDQNPTQHQVNQGEKSEPVNQIKEEEDRQVEEQEETHQGVEPLYEGEEAVGTETVMANVRDTDDEQESRGTPRSGSELRRRRLNRFQEEPL